VLQTGLCDVTHQMMMWGKWKWAEVQLRGWGGGVMRVLISSRLFCRCKSSSNRAGEQSLLLLLLLMLSVPGNLGWGLWGQLPIRGGSEAQGCFRAHQLSKAKRPDAVAFALNTCSAR